MKRAHHEISNTADSTPPHRHNSPLESNRAPKISRKIHACTECQGRKIKCDLVPGLSICGRCQRKGLSCVVNKSLQSLLEDDLVWKTAMERTSQQLSSAVSEILRHLDLPNLESFRVGQMGDFSNNDLLQYAASNPDLTSSDKRHKTQANDTQQNRTAGMAMTRENSQEAEIPIEASDTLVAAPMGTLYEVTRLRNLRSNPHGQIHSPGASIPIEDFITKGRIAESEALELFKVFNQSLNHYLWGGIALVHEDLKSVRTSSSLLLAAILTVTALHVPGKMRTFDICYSEFLALVCDSMLDRYHSLDGVRGLCIGAFWLSDVSWKLSGHAVRIATELNLHQSYIRAINGSVEHVEGARLWYLLYVCDHHFSIAYGRPPVIHNDLAITGHERFLQLSTVNQADLRLHSQISLFIILTEVYNTFGPDIGQSLTDDNLTQLRHFNISLDAWRIKWEGKLAPNTYIGSYPSKGVVLHYQFAKLQLNSLSLRGLQHTSSYMLSSSRREFANIATSCAMATLRMVLEEPEIRNALVGVPLYLHTMISYSAVFLIKVQMKWKSVQLGTDSSLIRDLISQVIDLLKQARASERHLTYHIADGLTRMLDRFNEWIMQEQQNFATSTTVQTGDGQVASGSNTSGGGIETADEYGMLGPYGEAMELYDGNFFPMGFFDIFSSYAPT